MTLRWALSVILFFGIIFQGIASPKYRHFSRIYSIDSNAIQCQSLIDNWNTVESLKYLKSVKENPDFEKKPEIKWVYEILNSQIHFIQYDFEPAKESIIKALEIAHELELPEMLIETYVVCGNFFEEQGELSNALTYFLAAKDLLDQGYLPSRKPFILNKIGTIYYADQNYNQASHYFFEAVRLYNLDKDSIIGVNYWMQNAYGNLGLCFEELKDYKKSLFYFRMALKIINQGYFSKERPLGVIYANMGHVYMNMGDLQNAKKYYEMGIQYTLNPLQRELKHGAKKQLELAKILIRLNQLKEARFRIDSSLSIINHENFAKLKGVYYATELLYYEKLNQNEIALQFSKKFTAFQDSIFQTQLKLGLSKQIISHSLNQKITENELLRKNEELNSLKNKSYLTILISLVLILFFIIFVIKNLTKKNQELNAALKEIEEQKQELQFSNSNINYLLQTVAHDLRTPVGNNLSLSRLLLESNDLHEDEKDLVQLMNTSSQHAISIMEDLLDHSLIERSEIILSKSKVNLSKMISDAARILSYKANPKNIEIITQIPDKEVYATLDESRVSRIVQNLVTNAIKFSQKNEQIIIGLSENATSVKIFVKDNGIGMDEKTRELAFDSFTSVGRTGTSGEKSYGLGLSICKKLIELHGGKIWVESFPGKGSTFYIEIPKL